jgi:uncharacterized protein (TIGR00369 family)
VSNVWQTLGFYEIGRGPGIATVGWTATEDYCFPSGSGPVVQGGLVTAVLDAAMGGACWTALAEFDEPAAFLTADLRVEFLRATRPGTLRAVGRVVRSTRRVVFCAADLLDDEDVVLATGRCTQVVLPGDAGRTWPPSAAGQ